MGRHGRALARRDAGCAVRILILHNAYAHVGGEDRVVAAESAALRARGHEVQLCIRDSAALHASKLRGAAETLLTLHNPDASRELERALSELRPDLVHVHNLFPRWGLSALRSLARTRVPVVQTLHNFRWLCAPAIRLRDGHDCALCERGNFESAVRFACMHKSRAVSAAYALALSLNRKTGLAEESVARFICVSEFVRDVHVAAGFPVKKLVVKGHFLEQLPKASEHDDGTILFAGRLSREKGLSVLLRALAEAPGLTLKVAGDGPERAELTRSLSRDVAARVRFLGMLPRARLLEELAISRACVVPSLGSETFGLSALEALAVARPVIASDAGGLPELVKHGVTGWVVARGDVEALAERLRWLAAHPAEARALGRTGRALVADRYLAGPNMEQLEHIYADAIAHAQRGVGAWR